MKISDFELELKKINPDLVIVPNPNRPGLSNVKLNGQDICPVPSENIKEEPDKDYRYAFPNGISARHNSIPEVIAKVEATLKTLQTEEGREIFYGK